MFEYLLTRDGPAKDHVLSIKGWVGAKGDKELRVVCVGSLIGHAQQVGLVVLQLEVLVLEGGAVNGLASCAVIVDEISSLCHEVLDYSVED